MSLIKEKERDNMLVIIIGIVVFVGLAALALKMDDGLVAFLGLVFVITAVVTGIIIPVEYEEWELVNETELVSLSNDTIAEGGGGLIYVSVSGENTYTYRYKISSEFGTETSKEYKVDTISEDVIESEDANCEVPVLREYVRKGKITIWTFGCSEETQYVFYVPEGTIQKDVKLN